jgi:hypothetical protein
MKDRPILFSGPMIRAILEDRKVQTRRVIKSQPTLPYAWHGCWDGAQFWTDNAQQGEKGETEYRTVPYGTIGDRLWVRETWRGQQGAIEYRADTDSHGPADGRADGESKNWRPSIFMPRWASRITLEVTGVRVERVQDITQQEVKAEGISPYTFARGCLSETPPDPRWKFIEIWNDINAKRGYSWESNPWVWVVEFKKV